MRRKLVSPSGGHFSFFLMLAMGLFPVVLIAIIIAQARGLGL